MSDNQNEERYIKLVSSIKELIKYYRALLQVVRKEKEILVSADLDLLNENNRTKEELLLKIRSKEAQRQSDAHDLALLEGLSPEGIRLQDFAIHFSGDKGEKLRNLHSVLKLLLERVKKINAENEILVSSALTNINGAMRAIKDSLVENKTYQKKGEVTDSKAQSGQLVSRQV
ncbi:MAG: flagellar protein FlgN [Bdellovibrionales bacterium]|nr:flagellar protein FlgN [Bdellovibrionales bacterium]